MSVKDSIRSAWKKLGGGNVEAAEAAPLQRKTLALPSILGPYPAPGHTLPKPTPANLRRFAETPVVRRAINIIKDRVASLDWQVRLKRDYMPGKVGYAARKAAILRRTLQAPNDSDSFRTLIEQVLEDALVGGYGAIEMDLTGNSEKPFELWPVDGATIRINPRWDGRPDSPRYAQATGLVGDQSSIALNDNELIYMRMNPRTYTPFGLGPLEVAFESVNSFLGAHRFAGKLASNSVVQYALWIDETTPAQQERLIRWWQDEIEGTGRVPILSSPQKPEVLRFAQGTDADLRLNWQQFLIRMIANAFNLPPLMLGLEQDVNKSTAGELMDEAFHSAITPLARLVAEHITRDLFAKRLGWHEFEFVFNELDSRDEMQEIEIQTALLAAGVLTVNEVRAMRGLSPLPGASISNSVPGPDPVAEEEVAESALKQNE
ncbi:phage portal protein [Silvibacterium acidisoli]|uniref:phage portal protein n=1 Tax=Acidobacteriaceae bacterium ZG23-2 TaxID=2883246 RepID=UPI00406D1DA2